MILYYNISNLVLTINNETFELPIPSHVNSVNIYEGLYLKITPENNIINLSIINTSNNPVILNNLYLNTFTVDKNDFDWHLVFDENLSNNISILPISNKSSSYMFSMFFSEDYLNLLVGFLSTKKSYNYIDIASNKETLSVIACYDFIEEIINPNEEFVLDSMYFSSDVNYINLITSYCDTLKKNNNLIENYDDKIYQISKRKTPQFLFTSTLNTYTLKKDYNPLSIKINGVTMYPIDLNSSVGKGHILIYINKQLENKNYIEINNIVDYIHLCRKSKSFNVYKALNLLFEEIKYKHPNTLLIINDCPLGLTFGNKVVYINTVKPQTSKIFNKLIYRFDMNFLIKSLLFNLIYIYENKYSIKNTKVKELLEILTNSLKPEYIFENPCKELASSLDKSDKIIPYIYKENIFSFLVKEETHYYIAIFNFSKKKASFYWDLSQNIKEYLTGSIMKDLFTGNTFQISNNTINLKSINSMDCCLLKLIDI